MNAAVVQPNSMLEKRMTIKWRAWGAVAALVAAMPCGAWAQSVIKSITSSQQAGSDVVRVELSEPLKAVPAGFTVQAPPRIAIDLPGVTSALGRPSVEVNQGNLRTVNVAQGDDRTRLVLNLRQAANYRAQIDGNVLLLVVDSGAPGATAGAAASPAAFAPSQNTQAQALREVDFRRGPDGSGRIVVDLPSTQVGVDIRQQGQALVVEFPRTIAPDRLRRRFDVTDFGTPVQSIVTTQEGDRVRMVVQPRGSWEHSAYQSDTQFVLEVRPMAMDPNKLVQGPGYAGEKLSLNFQNIDVRALLQVIADFTNFNIVTSDSVTGSVTLRLKDVPWDQALDIILQAKGLGMRKTGNVIWVAPKDELLAREQSELEAKKKITDLEPVRTQSFQLNYIKAAQVAKSLTGETTLGGNSGDGSSSWRMLSARGSVIFEPRTNQLFVTDIPSKLEEVQELIRKVDIAVRQVQIEARIVEADDRFGQSLGVKLGGTDLRGIQGGIPGVNIGGNNYAAPGANYNMVGAQTLQGGVYSYADSTFVNLPAAALAGTAPATFALTLFSAGANRFLNLELSALEADGLGKIVSSPRVITADQTKASIEQGEEIPYQNATSSGATAVEFKKATLSLEVTPQITPEGNVILDVIVSKDSRGLPTTAGPAINTKRVVTQVLVENGGTVVIGGIFQQEDRTDVNKVPLLGDIPVVGWLFKNTVRSTAKTELLVFITPKVVTEKSVAR
jgi:type IV pilus assembly protein PilQ